MDKQHSFKNRNYSVMLENPKQLHNDWTQPDVDDISFHLNEAIVTKHVLAQLEEPCVLPYPPAPSIMWKKKLGSEWHLFWYEKTGKNQFSVQSIPIELL